MGAPFAIDVDLSGVLALWGEPADEAADSPEMRALRTAMGPTVQALLDKHPWLKESPIDVERLTDPETRRELAPLFAPLLAPYNPGEEVRGGLVPFDTRPVFGTESFIQHLAMGGEDAGEDMVESQALFAYSLILNRLYGIPQIQLPDPVYAFTDPSTGFLRAFSVSFDARFLHVEAAGQLPVLSGDQLGELRAYAMSVDELQKFLPPERFRFSGVTIARGTEVTDQILVSEITAQLLQRNMIVEPAGIEVLESLLRAYFGNPELWLQIASVTQREVMIHSASGRDGHSHIPGGASNLEVAYLGRVIRPITDYDGSIFVRVTDLRQAEIITDFAQRADCAPAEQELRSVGVRSILVAPLAIGDTVIGTVNLTSGRPASFTQADLYRLNVLLPAFSVALKRAADEMEASMTRMIQKRYTAIHPSVGWRFREEALRLLAQPDHPTSDLVFESVYPLYAVTDIRKSSDTRTRAIQADMLAHIDLARDVLAAGRKASDLPVLAAMDFELETMRASISERLSSGQEIEVLTYLQTEVEPCFPRLEELGRAVAKAVRKYRDAMDPNVHSLYRERRKFDESVSRINATIGRLFDSEQVIAQQMFPHYFDKRSTDGVDMNLYIGQSLVQDRVFDRLYLRNLRLWQLIVVCRAGQLVVGLQDRLETPLETANLIVVQDLPLTLRFSPEEKGFVVDGAYNIRYEIMKKRIDKAEIRETGARLTDPGTLSVVYSQAREAEEYRQYLAFLAHRGLVSEEVEDHLLGDLQGISGLRALRVQLAGAMPDETVEQLIAGARARIPELVG